MTKEEVKQDMKNRAEDAHIVDEQQPKKENKKRSFFGKVLKKYFNFKKNSV